jgi:hypothetical protein
MASLGFTLSEAQLSGATSEQEMVRRVVDFARGRDREWIVGRGWDQNLWPSQQFPTRAALDVALPDRPVFLVRVDGHALLANSAALRRAGIGKDTKDPDGGRIVRDGQGEPTGVLVDTAMDLLWAVRPPASVVEREEAFLRAQDVLLAFGVTGIHDAGLSSVDQTVLEDLEKRGKLKIRIYGMASADAVPARPHSGEYYELRAVKAYADGALGSRGAALLAPYSDDPAQSGLLVTPPRELRRMADVCLERGFQLCTHAIGDRGNRIVLDTYEAAFAARGQGDAGRHARFRIEHCQVVAPGDFERFRALGVIASMQPTHCTSDGPWAPLRIGAERMKGAYAWRDMLKLQIPLAFGSDFPVESPDPRLGLFAAATRRPPERPDHPAFAGEVLTLREALYAYTAGAAWASFHEDDRGRLRAGYAADFTIFDRDFLQVADPAEVLRARVVWTVVAGAVVRESSQSSAGRR